MFGVKLSADKDDKDVGLQPLIVVYFTANQPRHRVEHTHIPSFTFRVFSGHHKPNRDVKDCGFG